MRVEVVAVGTELLFGQVVDTNSSWMGEHLAAGRDRLHFTRRSATTTPASSGPADALARATG